MIRAHQPGAEPVDIPEAIPNPAVVPQTQPAPLRDNAMTILGCSGRTPTVLKGIALALLGTVVTTAGILLTPTAAFAFLPNPC